MQAAMGSETFERLIAAYQVEPWGEHRADCRMAMLGALFGKEGAEKLFYPTDFPPPRIAKTKKEAINAVLRSVQGRSKWKPGRLKGGGSTP
jgi:hypothetical protein